MKFRILISICLASLCGTAQNNIRCAVFTKDLKGTAINAYNSLSVTLYTDANQWFDRPVQKIWLLNGFPLFMPLTNTLNLGNVDQLVFTGTMSVSDISRAYIVDTFWVAGIKNFSRGDKSRISLQMDIGPLRMYVDEAPRITNLPLSLANFTVNGNQVTFNPRCTDADGDSLVYELGPLSGTEYWIPSNANIDPVTGLFTFTKDSLDLAMYAFSIRVNNFRKGVGVISIINLAFVLTTNLTLGIENNEALNSKLQIYPNPGKGNYRIYGLDGTFLMSITDMLGCEVENNVVDFDTLKVVEFTLEKRGIYLVTLQNGNARIQRKVVVD